MLMPDRHGYKVDGGWASGNDQVNGNNVPQTLTVDNRNSNNPTEYKASQWIEITDGFESGTSDEFVAYIADGSNTTGGNTTGSGGQYNVYRYGFNGKENDDEVKGEGNSVDYGARVYDPRIAVWLSLDPLQKRFPYESNFSFCSSNPIIYLDKEGKRKYLIHRVINEKTGEVTEFKIVKSNELKPVERIREVHHNYSDGSTEIEQEWGIDWHDINEVHTTILKKDGTIQKTMKTETGAVRTRTTLFNTEWWAEVKAGDMGGGIIFYSATGQGQETRTGELADPQMENIDNLMAAIGNFKTAAEVEKFIETANKFATETNKLKKVGLLAELINITVAVTQLVMDNIPERRDSATCPRCKLRNDSAHIDQNTEAGRFNKLKQAGETDSTKQVKKPKK
jgi:RHS repeat-associated protein